MLRVLVFAVTAALTTQTHELAPASQSSSYAAIRDRLDAARAAGTLSKEQARLAGELGSKAPALADYLAGYAALLAYDRPRADQLLTRSFNARRSAHVASPLAMNLSDMGRQTACVDWATRGIEADADRAEIFIQVELRVTRSLCFFYLQKNASQQADVADALLIATESGDHRAKALALRVQGTMLHNAGRPLEGLAAINEAVEINAARGETRALAGDLFAMAAPYASKFPFAEKIPLLGRALKLAVSVKDRQMEGRILGQRGATFMLLGQHGQALRDLTAADAILREVAAVRSRAAAAGNLSMLYTELGDYTRAEEQGQLAYALYQRAESENITTLSGLSTLALRRGDSTSALKYQQQLVGVGRAQNDQLYLRGALLRLGRTHLVRREFKEAESALIESARLSDASGDAAHRASAYAGLGDLFRIIERDGEAAEAYSKALTLGANTASQSVLDVTAHHGLGLLHARQRRHGLALEHFRIALNRIEQTRENAGRAELQLTYFADKHALYVDAIDALVEADHDQPHADYLREAFLLAERAKARTLLDALAARPAVSDTPATVTEIAAALDDSDLLVEFIVGARQSFVFTLNHASVVSAHRLPSRTLLERLVTDFRATVNRRPTGRIADAEQQVKRAGEELYKRVLAPVLTQAPLVRRLIIVGDGLLFYAPFEALVATRDGPYLGEQYEIARAPSGSVLTAIRQRNRSTAATQFVGFGDPIVDGNSQGDDRELVRALEADGFSFAPLPGSGREVSTVAQLFGVNASRVYTRKTFTAQAALDELQKPNRIVHFATHAILDERVPGRSGIVVSNPNGTGAPSILRARDLAGLKIPVDLITLSGCQTGLGRVVDGEGVTGLAWAFTRAGAGSVMVTLWDVSDAASATMMVAFYRALGGGEGKAAALRTARRQLLQGANTTLRHPYYWAGYALVGDPR
jgi:CHAT domain-containing protein